MRWHKLLIPRHNVPKVGPQSPGAFCLKCERGQRSAECQGRRIDSQYMAILRLHSVQEHYIFLLISARSDYVPRPKGRPRFVKGVSTGGRFNRPSYACSTAVSNPSGSTFLAGRHFLCNAGGHFQEWCACLPMRVQSVTAQRQKQSLLLTDSISPTTWPMKSSTGCFGGRTSRRPRPNVWLCS
jgi:hypothetical protein